jgi:hypothetical protein
MLDDPGRVRRQITNVVCQIQRFDFDCNLVVTRKVIIRIPAGLGLNPPYSKIGKYTGTYVPVLFVPFLLYIRRSSTYIHLYSKKKLVYIPVLMYMYYLYQFCYI